MVVTSNPTTYPTLGGLILIIIEGDGKGIDWKYYDMDELGGEGGGRMHSKSGILCKDALSN